MRSLGSAIAGISIALLLFLLMSQLIAANRSVARSDDERLNLDFIRLDLDEVENIRRRMPPPEPTRATPPPALPPLTVAPQDMAASVMPRLDVPSFGTDDLQMKSPLEFGRFDGAMPLSGLNDDGDVFPVLRVEPVYPTAARIRKVNGWVDLEYTVMADGTVRDIVVVRSEPLSTFDDSAVAALGKWRFKPRVTNGQPVAARVEQRIYFNVLN